MARGAQAASGACVGVALRERELACSLLGRGDDACERRMGLASFHIGSARVCDRRQQGVPETDRLVLGHEDSCRHQLGDRLTRVARTGRSVEQGHRRLRGRGREQGDKTGGRRERGEARAQRLRQTWRYRDLAASGIGIRGQHASDLQGEQRVATAQLVNLHDPRPGKGQLEPLVEEAVHGAEAEGPDRDHCSQSRVDRVDEWPAGIVLDAAPARRDDCDTVGGHESPKGEGDHGHRGTVEPLRVVDREHQRAPARCEP
jgi:hypothetical protein